MLNDKFKQKISDMSINEACALIGTMAHIIELELEDVAHYDDSGKMLPKSEQPFPFIRSMMDVLEID